MQVSCPKCRARYEVPDEKLSRGAVKIRCSRCAHLFAVRRRPEAPPEPPEARFEDFASEGAAAAPGGGEPAGETGPAEEPQIPGADDLPPLGELDLAEDAGEPAAPSAPQTEPEVPPLDDLPSLEDLDLGDFAAESAGEQAGEAARPEAEIPAADDLPSLGELDLADFEADVGGPEADAAEPEPELERVREDDLVPPRRQAGVQVQGLADDMPRLDLQRGPRSRPEGAGRSPLVARDRRRSPLFWVVVLAVAGAVGFTGYNVYRHPEAFTFLSPSKIRALWHRRAVGARLAVQNVEGYYRDLAGGRRVFVIRGEVWNRSQAAQSLVRVRGNLFDDRGRTLASREVYCGNVLTERDLATLSPADLEARLQNEVGEGLSNMDIRPGGRVPFMVVFLPAPEGAVKFNAEVVEAREGASGG